MQTVLITQDGSMQAKRLPPLPN